MQDLPHCLEPGVVWNEQEPEEEEEGEKEENVIVRASSRQIGKELKNQEAMRHREEICGKKICTSRRVVKVELDQVDQVINGQGEHGAERFQMDVPV